MGKFTCTNFVEFDKCQDGTWLFCWSKNDSLFSDEKFKDLKKLANLLQLVQNITMWEIHPHLSRLLNQQVVAAKKLSEEVNLSPVQIVTMSRDTKKQLELVNKEVYVVDCSKGKTWVILMLYNLDKPENSFAWVRLFARNKEENLQKIIYVNHKLYEFKYQFFVRNFIYDDL